MNNIKLSLKTLVKSYNEKNTVASVIEKDKEYVDRILDTPLSTDEFNFLKDSVKYVGVTKNFREIIDFFKVPSKETPAGFKIEYAIKEDGLLSVDLARDISYDKNGIKRPTKVLFSPDSANPYEIDSIKT